MRITLKQLTRTMTVMIAAVSLVVASVGAAGASDAPPEDPGADVPTASSNREAGDEARSDKAQNDKAEDKAQNDKAEDVEAQNEDKARNDDEARNDEARNDEARGGSSFETAEPEKTFDAKALDDHECDAEEWHFVITQVAEGDYPATISVTWANDDTAALDVWKYTGHTAHYRSTANLDSTVTGATAELPGDWSGQFNLSHGPCNGDGGEEEEEEEVSFDLGSVTVVCTGEEAGFVGFFVDGDGDGTVTVTLFDGRTPKGSVDVDLGERGRIAYPGEVTGDLRLVAELGDERDIAPVPEPDCAPSRAPEGGDEGPVLVEDDEEVLGEGEERSPEDGQDIVVEGDEVVNVPVLDQRQPAAPVQPVVRPVSVVDDGGPAVLGSTVNRGQLARTGAGSELVLVPFGLALVLAGFALQLSGRRARRHA